MRGGVSGGLYILIEFVGPLLDGVRDSVEYLVGKICRSLIGWGPGWKW